MSKFGWDLPPGCRLSDIPGNSAASAAREAQADALYEVVPDLTDEQLEKLVTLQDEAFDMGYQQAVSDAVESKLEAEYAKAEQAYADEVLDAKLNAAADAIAEREDDAAVRRMEDYD